MTFFFKNLVDLSDLFFSQFGLSPSSVTFCARQRARWTRFGAYVVEVLNRKLLPE